MKYIKLVASDLDGTLLDKNKEITPRLYHALEQMNEQGIYFVPATGRPFSTVPQAIKALPFLRYVITSNGAAIYDAVEKKAIIENNPVSYTHLDVYKRQALSMQCVCVW